MRSDTPKVLHTLAGRSMLAHALHTVAKVAPQHFVVVLGHDRERSRARGRASWPTTWAGPSTSRCRSNSSAPATPSACGLSALPDDFAGIVVVTSGDVPLLDADTLADLIAAHSAESAAATVLTTTLPDPTGYGRILRTQDGEVIGIVEQADASPSQQAITEVNAGVYAFDIAALRSALEPAAAPQRPAGAVPDRRHLDRPRRRARRAGQARRRLRAGRRGQRPGAAGRAGRRAEPAHRGRASTRRRDDRRPRHHLDRRRRDHRPRHRHPPRHAAARRDPHRRALPDRPRHHADRRHRRRRGRGGAHPRQLSR